MNKSEMFLLEVFEKSALTGTQLFKRRISDNIQSIEDWIMSNAQKWSLLPITVECDEFGNGVVSLSNDANCTLYEFKTTNIGFLKG